MSILGSLLKKPFDVIEEKIASVKHEVQIELTIVIARVALLLIIGLLALLTLTLASIGLSLGINNWLNHPYAGFLWVGVLYIILTLLVYLLHKNGLLTPYLKKKAELLVYGKVQDD